MAAAKSKSNAGRKAKGRQEAPEPEDLLLDELRGIYSAEKQLTKVLPRLSKAIQNETLREALDRRVEQGQTLTENIEEVFDEYETTAGRTKNAAAEGLITEAQETVQTYAGGPELDAMLIGAMQKTEHYCIAAWGTAKAFAKAIGEDEIVASLERALDEGKSFDQALTRLAEDEITPAIMDQYEEVGGEEARA
ncbi:MAG TPA: DUF892 family protein [Caulobacteraceae bacterium]|jgi:ferritin-like metal-binding protein YciE|nr:DUF892 family protein [Caulobacteraceae bacterium]